MKDHHVVIVVIPPLTPLEAKKRLHRVRGNTPAERLPCYYVEKAGEEIQITPNTPAWFDWLDGLNHFDFDGLEGDFTAHKQPTNKPEEPTHWIASQKWADKEYQRDLGATHQLSTFHLEAIATDLEDEVAANEIGGTGEDDLRTPYVRAWKQREHTWSYRTLSSRSYQCFFAHEPHSTNPR